MEVKWWVVDGIEPRAQRDLVYSQTSGHRSLFAQPIDWYPMSGLNRPSKCVGLATVPTARVNTCPMLDIYIERRWATRTRGSGHVVQEPARGSVLAPPTRFELVAHRIDSPVPPQV